MDNHLISTQISEAMGSAQTALELARFVRGNLQRALSRAEDQFERVRRLEKQLEIARADLARVAAAIAAAFPGQPAVTTPHLQV